MPGELEKISRMLEEGSAELQCAAAMVLGELKPGDAAVRKALAAALKSANESVRRYALEALAAIDALGALPQIVPLLGGPDPLRKRAAEILSGLGAAGAEPLRERLEKADPAVRRGIHEVLGRLQGVDTTEALFGGLLDSDLEVVRKAAEAYRGRVAAMNDGEKAKALKRILEFMGSPRVQKLKTPIASCLSIVGALKQAAALKPVAACLDRKQPPAVRTAALQALAQLPLDEAAGRALAPRLLPLAEDEDFNGLVRPALDVLYRIAPGKGEADRLLKLLKSAHPPVRLYAVKALASVGTTAAAQALLEALAGADPRVAEVAGASLRANPDYVPLLVKALEKADPEDVDAAWRIGNVLRAYGNVLEKGVAKRFLASCLSMLAKKQSGFQVFFEVARAASAELAKAEVLKRGRALLAAKKFEEAERVLRLLGRDELATPESDLALAISHLHLQRLDPTTARSDRGNALALFSKVARAEKFPFLKALQKEAALVTPMGLLYLGFAFIERQGAERDAGAEILKLVAKKYASKEEGKIARQKLKTQGIG